MAMKLDFICCIGGELKDVISGTTKNSRIYMYRAYENQTIADMTQDGFFNQAQELRENDLIVLFDPENDNAYDMVKVSSVRGGIVKTTKVQTPDIKTIFARLKELSEKIDKEITDRTKADSVLQKQITTNANNIATNTGNITTLRNDVDGLGDQVHEIEAKIPQNATASNQLATKADLVTKADTTTVNTELAKKQDKLVSGTNIKTVNGESLLGSGDVKIDAGGAMPVGAIFLTMRNDNELNGAVECDGATYNTTDFTGAQSIGQLLADGRVPYVSMATYATEISTKGWCDKFGWDGTDNVQFKVPTLSAYIWQKLQLGIKGSIGTGSGGTYFVATQSNFSQYTHPESGAYGVSVSNDQTIPGATVNVTAEDVSQQRCMVQLATGATDEALETCTSVLADVAGLKDMSNVTAAGKNTVVGWGMPDYSAGIDVSGYKSSTNQFTAPKDGILSISVNSNTDGSVYIDNVHSAHANNNDLYARASIILPISKGEKFYAPTVLNLNTFTSCFYPYKGE